jgi:hypothetical protein
MSRNVTWEEVVCQVNEALLDLGEGVGTMKPEEENVIDKTVRGWAS